MSRPGALPAAPAGAEHFCTYFDAAYLPRGLALAASLRRHCPHAVLWVLCLDDRVGGLLRALGLPQVRTVELAELEAGDEALSRAKADRSRIEYYFTCTPCWPRFLLRAHPEIGRITYLDADLYFFSSPEPVFAELEGRSVGVIEHRFAPQHAHMARNGRFNVGWVTFVRDAAGLACLEWWRERCNEWCFDRNEAGRYADQKYLDRFEELFDGVQVVAEPGANLAPWNLPRHRVEPGNLPRVDGRPLIFFHFHGLRRLGRFVWDPNLEYYGIKPTRAVRRCIFAPYLAELRASERRLAGLGQGAELGTNRYFPDARAGRRGLDRLVFLTRKVLRKDFLLRAGSLVL